MRRGRRRDRIARLERPLLLAGLAAAIMPARRASRLNVLDALHYE